VIVGDANMSEVATYLKVGTTALVLSMIEDNALGDEWLLHDPVRSIVEVSHDPALRQTVALQDGRRVTALELQWGLFERAQKYERSHGLEPLGEAGADILARWETVLAGLERDPESMAHWIDWVAKRRLVDGYASRHGIPPAAPKLKAIDLQYHDLRSERCLALRAGLDTLVDPGEVTAAVDAPPRSTRAYFRGRCLQKYPDDIVAANWDSLVFDVGRDPLRRVPMMEPLRGTADHVATLIEESETAGQLLDRLGQ
jgi:proteasome accessory factor A